MQKKTKLLIGTSNKIYLLDTGSGHLDLLLERERRKKWFFFDDSSKGFFGISCLDQCTVIAAAREKLGTPKAGKPATDTIVHRCCISSGETGSICQVLDVHDVHQIAHYQGKVYLTDTGKNRVVVTDLNNGEVVALLNVGSERRDVSHINAVTVQDNYLLVGLNNRGEKEAEIIQISLSQLSNGECDLLEPKLGAQISVLPNCYHTHDLLVDNGRIMFCASHDGNIHIVGDDKPFYTSSDWVRGLAATEDRIWVGVSQKAERSKRHSEDLSGEVVEIDKASGKELRRIHLPGAGQVNDLLCLPSISSPEHL